MRAPAPGAIATLPAGWRGSACAFTAGELRRIATGALTDSRVRVGFEKRESGLTASTTPISPERATRRRSDQACARDRTETRDLFFEPRRPAVPSRPS